MLNQFSRTELLFGNDAVAALNRARVAVFGIGGVGGYTAEALIRSGLGSIDIIDNDTVSLTNLNRQIYALHSTLGRYKVDVAAERIADINPSATVRAYKVFYSPETADSFDLSQYDYIVDAIDTVTGKIALAVNAAAAKTPIISSMGAGNKLDPAAFRVSDLFKTRVCPLAKVMRTELKKRGINRLKVVYSEELPMKPAESSEKCAGRRQIPGSTAFVPSVAGLIIAGEVIKDITGVRGRGAGV